MRHSETTAADPYFTSREYRVRLRSVVATHTYRQLAAMAGVSPETIRRFLRGDRPTAVFLACVCLHFGISLNWLVFGDGPEDYEEATKGLGTSTRRPSDASLQRLEELLQCVHDQVGAAQRLLSGARSPARGRDYEVVVRTRRGRTPRAPPEK
ncbi:MAG TPA: helix-turn-helix transcriptional regulator [Phycisphaerales bacterium]|nr:helix-turn-helix transcriptional regulator [Phycisphaerales bacterium]